MTPGTAPLSVADAGELLTMQRAAFASEAVLHGDPSLPPLVEPLSSVRAVLESPTLVLGIRDAGRLIAAGRLDVSSDGTVATIGRLAVAPDRQGEGLGRLLLSSLEAVAPPGVREFRLFTGEHNTSNLRRYERAGYRITGRSPTLAGYDLVHLAKPRPVTDSSFRHAEVDFG